MTNLITSFYKTYCFHCGKEITYEDKEKCGIKANIHIKCQTERKKIIYHLKRERFKKLMSDPEIREKIKKIDEEVINKIRKEKI